MKSIFKRAMALLLAMLMSMGVIAPAVAEGEDTIKLAVIAPLTGDFAQYGEAYRTAVELMVSQVNAEGGINGKQLTYDIFDDKNDMQHVQFTYSDYYLYSGRVKAGVCVL